VRRLVELGVSTFVECGPGGALTGMVKRIVPEARTHNVADAASLEATVLSLFASPARASVQP
jgi:[acyl-carrier-protein] S-malonyltransferase